MQDKRGADGAFAYAVSGLMRHLVMAVKRDKRFGLLVRWLHAYDFLSEI
jgi:hypothetical protein